MCNKQWKLNEYLTYILLTLVLLSSWTDINGIFTELPQIVLTQPEGWKLGSHIGLVASISNIAPLALVFCKCAFRKRSLNVIPINYIVIFIGMVSCFLLVFFWSNTTYIFNRNRSVTLLILTFFLALLDCTAMVTFSHYMTRFRTEFTSALFLGESLTMIIPSLLAIVQGNGQLTCVSSANKNIISNVSTIAIYKTARFSVSVYFLCIFLILVTSFIAFVLLQWTKIAQNSSQNTTKESMILETNNANTIDIVIDSDTTIKSSRHKLIPLLYILLLLGSFYTSSIIFGMVFSISAYVLMPYGHQIFYLGTILSPWMLALTWLFGTIKPFVTKRYLLIMIILGSIIFGFDLILSLKSPCPLLVNTMKGNVLVLIIWLSTFILLGYPRLVIANYVRIHSTNGMFWFGANVQLGALMGSIVAYLMVETFSLFKEKLPCEKVQC
jgi:riboflavin transporter 2